MDGREEVASLGYSRFTFSYFIATLNLEDIGKKGESDEVVRQQRHPAFPIQ
jgi:hypothetical protein